MTPSPHEMTPTWRCLNETDLASYADGRLTGWRKTHYERHIAGCRYCRSELAFLLRAERTALRPLPPGWMERARTLAHQTASPPAWRWARAGITALVAFVAVGSWMVTRPSRQQIPDNTPPASAAAPVEHTQGPSIPEPPQVRHFGRAEAPIVVTVEHDRSGLGVEFRWKPVPSAVTYDLRVLDAAGDTVWHFRTRSEQLRLPASVALKPGQKYFALISASLPNGKAVRSRATPFEAVASQERR